MTGSLGPSSLGKPPKPPATPLEADGDDDDDFLKTIVAAAGSSVSTGPTQTKDRQGLVLARDADGFERLMDARHVSEEAIVVRSGEEVQCPGCKDWFPEEKPSCPTCFREGGRVLVDEKSESVETLYKFVWSLAFSFVVGLSASLVH